MVDPIAAAARRINGRRAISAATTRALTGTLHDATPAMFETTDPANGAEHRTEQVQVMKATMLATALLRTMPSDDPLRSVLAARKFLTDALDNIETAIRQGAKPNG